MPVNKVYLFCRCKDFYVQTVLDIMKLVFSLVLTIMEESRDVSCRRRLECFACLLSFRKS